ncbi:MAG: hypothetical protein AAB646_02300, partial [Patescibacteria group bacterium]
MRKIFLILVINLLIFGNLPIIFAQQTPVISVESGQTKVIIQVKVTGAKADKLIATLQKGGKIILNFELFDDGKHNDQAANDSVWGNVLDIKNLEAGEHEIFVTGTTYQGVTKKSEPAKVSILKIQKPMIPVLQPTPPPTPAPQPLFTFANAPRLNYEQTAIKTSGGAEKEVAKARGPLKTFGRKSKKAVKKLGKKIKKIFKKSKKAIAPKPALPQQPQPNFSTGPVAITAPEPFIFNGLKSEKLDVLFVTYEMENHILFGSVEDQVKKLVDQSFKAVSPFKENFSKINIWTANATGDVFTGIFPSNINGGNLSYDYDKQNFALKIAQTAISQNPSMDQIIVLARRPVGSFAQINGNKVIVSVHTMYDLAVGKSIDQINPQLIETFLKVSGSGTIMHELGHSFGGLFDEYAAVSGQPSEIGWEPQT